jgi:hypothetical protein
MRTKITSQLCRLLSTAALLALVPANAQQVGANDIAGVVKSAKGAEAGVWVIAETKGLGTRFAKIVVTDDEGRYLVPDLPKAHYSVWVRGYGLVDSEKVASDPGKTLDLTAVTAPTPAAAAHYYPAIYWYSMLKIPDKAFFSGETRNPNLPPAVKNQGQWINQMKNNGCVGCHQLGNEATRTIPAALGEFKSSEEAWMRRLQSGQAGEDMTNAIAGNFGGVPYAFFADWTDRIAKGELPASQPPRPQGVERNVVVTVRDWMDEKHYLHDLTTTDRRKPTVNGNGLIYGSTELSTNLIPVLDPVKNVATTITPPINPKTPLASKGPLAPSPYWGDEKIWDSQANAHNARIDEKGRVWFTMANRSPTQSPAYCNKGSDHPSAKFIADVRSTRQAAVYDPATKKMDFIDLCFQTHHLEFDANGILWFSGGSNSGGDVIGWINTKVWDETHDAAKSQGWTNFILDTNGNGKRDEAVAPNQPVDPAKDKMINVGFYAVMPNPKDGSVWGSHRAYPGEVIRLVPGANPPDTALAEVYNVPMPGFGVRGGDIDRNGVVWVALASGHLGEFDRSKCKGTLNGPTATGNQCPEGWTFHQFPGPGFKDIGENSAESPYYAWVDQWNTFGLGDNIPMATGDLSDSILALVDGKFLTLRVPYPMGFYTKGFEGRIDDANGGWKGRGLWATTGDRVPWHHEGGKTNKPIVVHVQLRPNPLAN